MPPSKQKTDPRRVMGALTIVKLSVPKIAQQYGCKDKILYAVLNGSRPGRDPKVQRAVAAMEEITRRVLCA